MEQCLQISGSIPAPDVRFIHFARSASSAVDGQACSPSISVSRPQTDLLQLPASDTKVLSATPVKRRGKSMSRRTGQKGHIEPSGRWWVVRWWMDVPEQDKRRHMRERICPISGPGSLSKSERERRAREIVAESGADTEEYFQKVVKKKGGGVTFREQAKWWLNHVQNRRRKPIALSTLELWEACLNNWINPNIGDLPLSEVNNAVLKSLVAKMVGRWSVAQVHRQLFQS